MNTLQNPTQHYLLNLNRFLIYCYEYACNWLLLYKCVNLIRMAIKHFLWMLILLYKSIETQITDFSRKIL